MQTIMNGDNLEQMTIVRYSIRFFLFEQAPSVSKYNIFWLLKLNNQKKLYLGTSKCVFFPK
jgi:hypothetical protein